MHTAGIWRIGTDAANLYLVSSSDDKTARVWELSTGRLLRILRPPIGQDREGDLTAIAISPDGKNVAVGGSTGYEWDKSASIYLFDRESGKFVHRLTGLRWMLLNLTYSKDGRYLAATMAANGGLQIYRTDNYELVGRDTDYEDRCNGVAFDSSNRLVTASHDGFIRLYELRTNGSLRLIAKRQVTGEGKPAAVNFSPDDSKVAVAYEDAVRIDILAASDLSPLFSPNTFGVTNELSKVTWSADGNTLYAGGYYYQELVFFIRAWSDGGRGKYQDIPAAGDEIRQILPMRDGGIVYGTAEPSLAVLDSNHQLSWMIGPSIASNKWYPDNFLVSDDGTTIQFNQGLSESADARFSIKDRMLELTGSDSKVRLHSSRTEVPELSITDWQTPFPKLNGKPILIDQYEVASSFTIFPDGQKFLLGTSYALRLYDKNGKLLGSIAAPSGIEAVNISSDGRFVVTACGDGTIRWRRLDNGREILAFFPHADGKRWVLWTPSGYYDASPGGEDFIGWHVNRGPDEAADFFPASQFRNVYYRPDVISKVLKVGDEQEALRLANKEAQRPQQTSSVAELLPPVVELISPGDGETISAKEVTARFRVRTPSGEPITSIRVLIDGRPINVSRELVQQGSESNDLREIRFNIPQRDSEVSIIAANRYAESVPVTVRLKWRGATTLALSPGTVVLKPTLYILAVGVSQYANSKYNLQFADKDARDFVNSIMSQKGLLYRDIVIYQGHPLTNKEATKDEILEGLTWIRKQTTSNDVAMIFFSGHGVNDTNNQYYFCSYNFIPEHELATGVSFSDIKNTLTVIAGKVLFFVDTCHSGNSLGMGGRRDISDINRVISELSSVGSGVVVFSASTSSEVSYERSEWKNGAFTKSMVEGLRGGADKENTGRITYTMLHYFISERVKELTNGAQHPTMQSPTTIPDFPIALRRRK
jgi:WD40 repeat protein